MSRHLVRNIDETRCLLIQREGERRSWYRSYPFSTQLPVQVAEVQPRE